MSDGAEGEDKAALDALSRRLDEARGDGSDARAAEEAAERGRAMGSGFRLASELLASMIVGVLLGLSVDALAGSSPFGLMVGIFIGFAAGLRNAARAMLAGDAAADDKAGGDAP